MSSPDMTPSPAAPRSRLYRWFIGACGLVVMLAGLVKVGAGLESFRLPDCDASSTIATVKDLFKKANAELDDVTNARLVSDGDGRSCAAHITFQHSGIRSLEFT